MTILLRLEKPRLELTVCGMVSQQWLDGLLSGAIGQSQGGLTEGQMMWRGIHRDAQPDAAGVAAPSATPTPTPRRPRRPAFWIGFAGRSVRPRGHRRVVTQ